MDTALRFYVERLGFDIDFRDEEHPDHYAGVRRDDVRLHMQWQHEEEFKNGTAGTLRVLLMSRMRSLRSISPSVARRYTEINCEER